jgi:hypothetical protein
MFFGDLFGHVRRELLPRPVAKGDGHGALGPVLPDHILVEPETI